MLALLLLYCHILLYSCKITVPRVTNLAAAVAWAWVVTLLCTLKTTNVEHVLMIFMRTERQRLAVVHHGANDVLQYYNSITCMPYS